MNIQTFVHPGLMTMLLGLLIIAIPKAARRWMSVITPCVALQFIYILDTHRTMPYKISEQLTLQLFSMDGISKILLSVFAIVAILYAVFGWNRENRVEIGLSTCYAGSAMSVLLAGDWITFFIFWEVTALLSVYLIYAGGERRSSRAAVRSIVIQGIAGITLLTGVLLRIYHYGELITNISEYRDASFWLILVGISVNAALPPFSAWLTESYSKSTVDGSFYLATYMPYVAVYALIRFFAGTEILFGFGLFMVVYAICMGLLENDLIRLMLYHLVNQLGLLIVVVTVGEQHAVDGAIVQAASNILVQSVLLMVIGAIIKTSGRRDITKYNLQVQQPLLIRILFAIGSLATVGTPFLAGCSGMMMFRTSLMESENWILSMTLVLSTAGSLLMMLKLGNEVFFTSSKKKAPMVTAISMPIKLSITMGVAFIVIAGVFPQMLNQLGLLKSAIPSLTLAYFLHYVSILVGGALAFGLFRKKCLSTKGISLDFDWFCRRPLASLLSKIHEPIGRIFRWFDVL